MRTHRKLGGGSGIAGRLRVEGRFFVNNAGTYRPVWESFLSHWMDAGRDAGLDAIAGRGANGFRSFCGDLGWAGQTPAAARAALPALLTAAAQRGLYVYVSALQGRGYDVEAHLAAIADICAQHDNAVLEGANEIGHHTQSDLVNDIPRFLDACRRVIPAGVPWTLGAPVGTDEPTPEGTYPTAGGLFNDAHLDRGRDFWNQVRRVREIENISATQKTAAISGEPIGAAEFSQPGRREADPVFFWTLGLLCHGFELASVFHSEDGLNGRLLGPNQLLCAEACVAGGRAIPIAERLQFFNASWANSPVTSYDGAACVRCYSFVSGGRGWTAVLGLVPDPDNPGHVHDPRIVWGGGWAPVGVTEERTARDGSRVRLIELIHA